MMKADPASQFEPLPCGLCSALGDEEYARQKFGWEEENTHLPAAAGKLLVAADLQPCGSRKLQILQCPQCTAYFFYRTDYEYLANGSEDEEWLTRLTPEQAADYLNGLDAFP